MQKYRLLLLVLVGVSACATSPVSEVAKSPENLDKWVAHQHEISWQLIQRNISPAEPKTAGGTKPLPGIVVAGLSKKDPDYYFHWLRDSANVMHAVIEELIENDQAQLDAKMLDFLTLSRKLQRVASPFGLGEPRFTVEGEVDRLPWSRPQFDGPALRALTILRYLQCRKGHEPSDTKRLAEIVAKVDLNFIAQNTHARGFDIWEELKADNYNTRLVQMTALEEGVRVFGNHLYAERAQELRKLLDDHWDPTRGFLRSQLAIEATDGYSSKKTDLDSAVIVAVIDANREGLAQSVADPRVQATVLVLENLFRAAYPINGNPHLGLSYGRYAGDSYYGGNPWPLITAYFATFYYRLANRLNNEPSSVVINKINLPFVQNVLGQNVFVQNVFGDATVMPAALGVDVNLSQEPGLRERLERALARRGDAIMLRLSAQSLPDGDFYEQFDKVSGRPVSSRGLGWAHAAFLTAASERARLRSNMTLRIH